MSQKAAWQVFVCAVVVRLNEERGERMMMTRTGRADFVCKMLLNKYFDRENSSIDLSIPAFSGRLTDRQHLTL